MPCIEFVHEGIEFTCIIYYAKEFEMLRRQCNINQLMIESLCRCQTWTASGGKSKSHFYKTQGSVCDMSTRQSALVADSTA